MDHPWLREGQWEDTVPLPSITKIEEIPPEDTEYILHRMELGGYGTQENILRCEGDRLLKNSYCSVMVLAVSQPSQICMGRALYIVPINVVN